MKWFDSLFARIFLLQLAVAAFLTALFTLVLFNEQASIFAQTTASLWSAALKPVQAQLDKGEPLGLPRVASVQATVALQPGPLPGDASIMTAVPLVPRYRALLSELRSQGIPVLRMAISGRTGQATTWIELPTAAEPVWVGVAGVLEGPDIRRRVTLGLLIAIAVFVAGAAWLSRLIAKPLLDLQARVKAFAATGEQAPASLPQGPAEVRQLTEQFHMFARQRAQQDAERNMMLAGISHDLRSPLGRIRMAAELLPDGPGVQAKRDSIVRNTQVADRLVGSFLDLARAAAEPLDERVDLRALVQRLLASSDHETVVAEMHAHTPVWLAPASSTALERMVLNLLDNAAKYGKPPVHVTLAANATHAVLTVRDHGPGIPMHQVKTLRKPFYRGDQDRGLAGTGLGLAIVERSVHRHGGDMQLLDGAPGLLVQLRFALATARG